MQHHQLNGLHGLRHIDTLKLVALALVTLGLYLALYIRRQSAIINAQASEEETKIAVWAVLLPQLSAMTSIATLLLYLAVGGERLEHIDAAAGLLFNISLVIWGFAARSAMHAATEADERSSLWFDGLFTLLLSPFYFNYRINEIFDEATLEGRREATHES